MIVVVPVRVTVNLDEYEREYGETVARFGETTRQREIRSAVKIDVEDGVKNMYRHVEHVYEVEVDL
jgi:hypothetical protein